jgi:hypothetical protein
MDRYRETSPMVPRASGAKNDNQQSNNLLLTKMRTEEEENERNKWKEKKEKGEKKNREPRKGRKKKQMKGLSSRRLPR